MERRKKKRKFVEDEFDLDEFIKQTETSAYKKFFKKNQRYINLISIVIMILAFVIAYLAYSILNYYIELWQNKKISEEAQNIYESVATPAPVVEPVASGTPETSGASAESALAEAAPTEPAPAGSSASPMPTPRKISREFIDMMTTFNNSDIVGFITIEGTNINYAVVKSNDNEFYLNHDLSKKPNVAGSIFMDYENRVDKLSHNTVIYGHNMKDGTMFHNLRYYEDENFFKEHRFITLKTLYEETKWEIFSFYETDTGFDYIKTYFANPDEFYKLALTMKEKSMYDTGVDISAEDKILTLSTCTNLDEDSRYTLNAKLIE